MKVACWLSFYAAVHAASVCRLSRENLSCATCSRHTKHYTSYEEGHVRQAHKQKLDFPLPISRSHGTVGK